SLSFPLRAPHGALFPTRRPTRPRAGRAGRIATGVPTRAPADRSAAARASSDVPDSAPSRGRRESGGTDAHAAGRRRILRAWWFGEERHGVGVRCGTDAPSAGAGSLPQPAPVGLAHGDGVPSRR